ncbi:secretory lipase-domain-containing protein [Gongronella butleri]|nr:secretory lipase-domain-containing protein [Gongronella butleri]
MAAYVTTALPVIDSLLGSANRATDRPIEPASDAFYQPPAGFENAAPGTILKTRVLPPGDIAVLGVLPQYYESVHQFLFRTKDALDQPAATVATLIIPFNAKRDTLLSYQIAEVSTGSQCAPSYALRFTNNGENLVENSELLFMDIILSKGIPVVTTDYEGPESFFSVGVMAGHSVLDGIRAVLSSGSTTRLDPHARVLLWGYSFGAQATGWAVQLHSSYASEINIVGAALGSTPVHLEHVMHARAVQKGPAAVFAAASLYGLTRQYPDARKDVESHIRSENRADFDAIANKCLPQLTIEYAFKDVYGWLGDLGSIHEGALKRAINANVMGTMATPSIPLFMYHSKIDRVMPIEDALNMAQTWCKQGAQIEFMTDHLSELLLLAATGAEGATAFLLARLEGKPLATGILSAEMVLVGHDPVLKGLVGAVEQDVDNSGGRKASVDSGKIALAQQQQSLPPMIATQFAPNNGYANDQAITPNMPPTISIAASALIGGMAGIAPADVANITLNMNLLSQSPLSTSSAPANNKPPATLRRRGSLESINSIMTENTADVQRQRLTHAVQQLGYAAHVEDIEKVTLAMEALDTFADDDDDEDENTAPSMTTSFLDNRVSQRVSVSSMRSNVLKPAVAAAAPLGRSNPLQPAGAAPSVSSTASILDAPKSMSTDEIEALLVTMASLPSHSQKQRLGDIMWPHIKPLSKPLAKNVKVPGFSSKVLVRLLDHIPLNELAHGMNNEAWLKQKVEEAAKIVHAAS